MHFEKKDDILMELTKTAENKTENDAWLSLVERYVRDVEVAGSNPVAPIFLCSFLRTVIKQSVFPNLKNGRTHYPLLRKTFALYSNATVLSSPPLAAH